MHAWRPAHRFHLPVDAAHSPRQAPVVVQPVPPAREPLLPPRVPRPSHTVRDPHNLPPLTGVEICSSVVSVLILASTMYAFYLIGAQLFHAFPYLSHVFGDICSAIFYFFADIFIFFFNCIMIYVLLFYCILQVLLFILKAIFEDSTNNPPPLPSLPHEV